MATGGNEKQQVHSYRQGSARTGRNTLKIGLFYVSEI